MLARAGAGAAAASSVARHPLQIPAPAERGAAARRERRPRADRLRILFVSYEYPPLGGGGGVVLRDLAEELAHSHDVTVLTSGRRGLAPRERRGRLEIVRTPVWMRDADATASLPSMLTFFPSSLATGYRLLRERSYDLVHSSFAVPSGPSGVLLARHFGLPHVLSVHGGDIYDPSKRLSPHRTPLLKQTVAWVLRASDRVVAQSSDIAERTRAIYGERRLDCVPLAVRPVPFERRSRADFGLEPQDPLLISVGRLVARKGLAELVEIFAGLGDPRAQLWVLGDGPLRADLEQRARELGVGSRVRFLGFVSDTEKWQRLALADLYVSTTLHEGFGLGFLEALESGVPVISYDRGGQADFVCSAVGALVPLGDRPRFAAEVQRHLADPQLRAAKSCAARVRAREYHVDRFAGRYLRIYGECLAEPARGRLELA